MRADADGLAAVEHDYLIRMADAADALGDDYLRGIRELFGKLPSQRGVRLIVERRERVIKYQYLRLACYRAGDGEALLLPAGDVAPLLGDAVVCALLQRVDEFRRL